ncbi:MAG: hypothetical protein ACK4WC_08690 [Rubrimonas sp.]
MSETTNAAVLIAAVTAAAFALAQALLGVIDQLWAPARELPFLTLGRLAG